MIVAGFWAASAAYETHLFFGLSVTGTSFLLWAAMGVVLGPTALSIEFKRPSWGVVFASVLTVIALLGIGWQIRFTAADHAYMQARIGTSGQARTAATLKAVRLNPYNDIYRAEVGLAYYDEINEALTAASQGDQAAIKALNTAFANAEASFKDTINFVPWEYDNYVFLANLYNLGSQVLGEQYDARAIETARQGIKVEPYGAAIRVQLARALDASGDTEGAIEQLQYALRLDPRYPEASLLLAVLYQGQGRLDDALKVLRASEAVAPDPNVQATLKQLEASAPAAP
jgi:tetratricopeptide (TPR) repeat protein